MNMKQITTFFILIFSVLVLTAQDTTNIFIGEWQVDEYKIVIGDQTMFVYQRDSLEKCQLYLSSKTSFTDLKVFTSCESHHVL